MLPPACVSLATPGGGLANGTTAALVGVLVADVAVGLTGRERA